jgi:hypothetical protein
MDTVGTVCFKKRTRAILSALYILVLYNFRNKRRPFSYTPLIISSLVTEMQCVYCDVGCEYLNSKALN